MGTIAKFEKKNDNFVSQMKTYFKGVKTESEGEEPNRHIVIKPL